MDFASIARTLCMPELQRRGTILRTAAQCGADEASIQRFIDLLANDIQMAPVHRLSLSEMESFFQAGQSHAPRSIAGTSQLTRAACASPPPRRRARPSPSSPPRRAPKEALE
jgi:hypothetical protein